MRHKIYKSRLLKNEAGQVLVFVIILGMMAALIITPILVSVYGGHRTTETRIARAQELYAADQGVEWALYQIIGNTTRVPQELEETTGPYWLYGVNGCDVDITIENTGNATYIVRSSGKKFNLIGEGKEYTTRASVEVHVTKGNGTGEGTWVVGPGTPEEPGEPPLGPFSYAVASLGDEAVFSGAPGGTIVGHIYIGDDATLSSGTLVMPDPETGIGGNIYVNGNLVISQGSRVMGSAHANGTITMTQPSQIDGYAYANGYIQLDNSARIGINAYAQTYIDLGINKGQIDGSAYADTNLILGAGTIVHQNGVANDSITVNSGTIYGTAYYMNSLNITGGGFVGDSVQMSSPVYIPMPKMPSLVVPDNPAPEYYAYAITGGTLGEAGKDYKIPDNSTLGPRVILGNMVMDNNIDLTLTGTVYVEGSITIKNNCSLVRAPGNLTTPAVLVANGDITITNNNVLTPDENMPLIMSAYGSIYCNNNGSVVAALYAPEGAVVVENNTMVDGAIVGQSIITKNNYTVTYNEAVTSIPGLPGGEGEGEPEPTPTPEPTTVPGPPGESFKGVRIDKYIIIE